MAIPALHGVATALIGRNAEMAAIGAALADPSAPGAVISGPRGVGKSRLARHALQIASTSGFETASILATRAAASIPFAAVEPLLGDALGARTVQALRSARERVRELSAGAPLVLLVDDAHHLDDGSAALVLQLATLGEAFVLTTVSTEDPAPDAVTALWKDSGCRRVDVAPLPEGHIDDLVRQRLHGVVDADCLYRLRSLSQGLPLAVIELVTATLATGALRERDGVWRLEGDVSLSGTLVDQVEARLLTCSESEQDALALIGLAGGLHAPVAERLVTAATLGSLERQGLVSVDDHDGEVVAAHPLYGEVARRDAGSYRRRELAGRLADITAEVEDPSATRDLRIAAWRLAAGGSPDPAELGRGARAAYRLGDHVMTAALARATIEQQPCAEIRAEASHLLGLSLGRLGRAAEAEQVLATAEPPPEGAEGDALRALLTMARSELLFRSLGDATTAMAVAEEAEATLVSPLGREEVVAHRAMLVLLAGDVTGALALLEPLLGPDVPDRPFVKAAYAAGLGLVAAGRGERAIAIAERALPIHESVWDGDLFQTEPAVHHLTSIMALTELGQWRAADDYVALALDATRDVGGYALGYVAMLAGVIALRRGHVARARRHFGTAIPCFRDSGYPGQLRWSLAGAATADALTGHCDAAAELLAEADALADGTAVCFNEAAVFAARGWLRWAIGDPEGARVCFRDGAADAHRRGEISYAARLWHALGRAGAAHEALAHLRQIRPDGDLYRLQVRHLEALDSSDGPGLEACATDFAAAGSPLLAAEAAAEAVRAHQRSGDQRAAARAGHQAARYAEECEGARTPSMTIPLGTEPLTDREREIAVLAADGLSSADIAERLVLSRRTVDNHLQRVFGKLGVSRRTDLPAALGRS